VLKGESMTPHDTWMGRAIAEARAATSEGNGPAAALIVRGDQLLGIAHNTKTTDRSGFAHAELNALLQAKTTLGRHPEGVTLYSTLEPCAMCLGAITFAGIRTVVYGAHDSEGGATRMFREHPVYGKWMPEVIGGIRESECEELKLLPTFRKATEEHSQRVQAIDNRGFPQPEA
jgi:tRNA(adenine34) deaminase